MDTTGRRRIGVCAVILCRRRKANLFAPFRSSGMNNWIDSLPEHRACLVISTPIHLLLNTTHSQCGGTPLTSGAKTTRCSWTKPRTCTPTTTTCRSRSTVRSSRLRPSRTRTATCPPRHWRYVSMQRGAVLACCISIRKWAGSSRCRRSR